MYYLKFQETSFEISKNLDNYNSPVYSVCSMNKPSWTNAEIFDYMEITLLSCVLKSKEAHI